MYDLLAIGDIKLDTFILIPEASASCCLKMPESQLCIDYGKKNQVEDIDLQIAGSAPNVAVGLSKMKKRTAVYSEMGQDIIHTLALDFLKKNKVASKYVKGLKNRDSSYAAILNYKGESTQLVSHPENIYRLPKKLPATAWIHVSELGNGYTKLYKDIIKAKKTKSFKISFNPGAVQIDENKKEFRALLKVTDTLFLNRVEAEQVLGIKEKTTIQSIMGSLKKLGPKFVVVTDGQNGAYSYDGEQLDFAPMFPGERVEATGAGDAFVTGYLGALLHKLHHGEAVMWGSVNAASVVGIIGPTKGLLTATEIKKRLKAKPRYKTKEL